MNITGRPIYPKTPKAERKRKGMRQISKKRAKQHASPEGQADLAYMGEVRGEPCCICGTVINVKAHHCKDIPPYDERGVYERQPGAGMKSGAGDTIPLCEPGCHKGSGHGYHDNPRAWREKHGPDYGYLAAIRKKLNWKPRKGPKE